MVRLNWIRIAMVTAGAVVLLTASGMWAQNFGSAVTLTRKKIVLVRKLPPTGQIAGAGVKVVANSVGIQGDVATTLKSDLENILLRNDPKLRTEDVHPDTVITCTITSYSQPPPQRTTEAPMTLGNSKKPAQPQSMERVTALMTVGFKAADAHNGRSLAADNVKSNYDQEFNVTQNNSSSSTSLFHSMTHSMDHLTKSGGSEETPPTPMELHDKIIQDAAMEIASHLVNTSEEVEVILARGGSLDEPVKLLESKLWARALESLETMTPFPAPEQDAYRLYDVGVANEALAYSSEDVKKARTFLQEAAINYGKAIDAKPTEKYFLQPQNRIDTALAHYKELSEEPAVEASSTSHAAAPRRASETSQREADPSPDALTNDQIIEMVAARMDESNIVDTIEHAPAVNFDLGVQGQIYLTKHGVNGRLLSAMKARARRSTGSSHHSSR
ncbi:MAG TPA: hypothetical protein VHY48_07485 [Acidobacteriaceae bacterium]|jgi:hypothetical protein|nr:hypothetical protein [Acidobacteriaceae bacterium]